MSRILATLAATAATAALMAAAAPAAAVTYDYTVVVDPSALTTGVIAVNDAGRIVGVERDLVTHLHHAFVGTRAGVTRIDPDGPIGQATESWAYSINGLGDIAGTTADASGVHTGYLRHADGRVETIAYPGAAGTDAYGVNDFGDMIGLYYDADGTSHAFTRRHGLQTVPLSINDSGTIVGEFIQTADTLGFGYLQRPKGGVVLGSDPNAPPEQTYWISINNRHMILGSYYDADFNFHNFVRRGTQDVPFDLPASWGAQIVIAETINDLGDVVGYYVDADGALQGFYAAARHAAK
jgi:hypothetical protein